MLHESQSVADFDLLKDLKVTAKVDGILPPITARHPHNPPHIKTLEDYYKLYNESIENPIQFWKKMGNTFLSWDKPFDRVMEGSFEQGDITWFADGRLNACYNCVDRHVLQNPNKVAIYWEGDEPGERQSITYKELRNEICQLSNVLLEMGLRKGDKVAIYLPMIPQAIVSMLACARLGIVHSVIFAGFSAESLRGRVEDGQCSLVITADQGKRGGKTIFLKKTVDEAVESLPFVKKVLVVKRTGDPSVPFNTLRDLWWHEELKKHRPYCPYESVSSEDLLFLLYTSGSTGKPKGVAHSTAGYLLYAAMTMKYIFDYQPNDVFGCMADVGWITGHSYIVYGPLVNGATVVLFESIPTYPDASRYWQLIDQYRVTQFYTAPTAIRALRKLGDEYVTKHDLSSLRVLGSVGEPINPEAWNWYFEVVGRKRCAIVDTYWQTETGGIVITPIATITPMKPGSASLPFFGIRPVILDPRNGNELLGDDQSGVLAIKGIWPGITRTIYGDHERYLKSYLHLYNGVYFTGDGASRDRDGFYWIQGRVDDVINVSSHRISTAEVESALIRESNCAESAVIGEPDELTGQAICAFCIPKKSVEAEQLVAMKKRLVAQVRTVIGPTATPKHVYVVPDLPKTRSGKIMRRILRKIVAGECDSLGDLSTLSNPLVVEAIISIVKNDQ